MSHSIYSPYQTTIENLHSIFLGEEKITLSEEFGLSNNDVFKKYKIFKK
jgi:hypothetical protein